MKQKYFAVVMNARGQMIVRFVQIKRVIYNNPATIVIWSDDVKTVVKCQDGDVYDPEKGLAMAIIKRVGGNNSTYNNAFTAHLPKEKEPVKRPEEAVATNPETPEEAVAASPETKQTSEISYT